jgi:Na+/H+-dicarboxylate symporter
LSQARSSKSFLQTLYFRVLVEVDRFLSEMCSVTNIIGNGVAVEDDATLREHAGGM